MEAFVGLAILLAGWMIAGSLDSVAKAIRSVGSPEIEEPSLEELKKAFLATLEKRP